MNTRHLIAVPFAAMLALAACDANEPPLPALGDGPVIALRRLTVDQYANIVADVFGPSIKVAIALDPLVRTDGLLAVGAAKVAMTPSGFEHAEAAARAVAAQVVDDRNRPIVAPCAAAASPAFDQECARGIFSRAGRLLFRRSLTETELAARLSLAETATRDRNDFAAGIAAGLVSLLTSPAFLYVTETASSATPDARLDGYSTAARLSFFLWNTTPDDALLAAAERGELGNRDGLARQADRMMASPRLERGVRAFFADMLSLEKFATLEKDTSIYPVFSHAVARDGREQVLRTIVEDLLHEDGDYRDLFTTRRVQLSDSLARLYRVPAPVVGGWGVHEFADGDPRVGLHSGFALTAVFSHPGRSSPTLRGRAIREVFLCQKVPDPPSDVDFTEFIKTASVTTARQRLDAHNTAPACAGCHKLMDPIGLSLENFDGVGQVRDTDGGAPIDASGEFDGVAYRDAAGLAQALRNSPALPACLVTRLYAYANGRTVDTADRAPVNALQKEFAEKGFRLPPLLRAVAADPAFYRSSPKPATMAQK